MKFGIGQPLKRKEDNKFLTGNGSYTDDLNFKDLAHMYIIRSPFAFAKINNIDISKANNLRGIYNIINYRRWTYIDIIVSFSAVRQFLLFSILL